jgi:hypothetical protein
MNMQQIIVALIVLAALARVLWKYLPARWRQRLTTYLGLRAGPADADNCHGCDGCQSGSACGPDRRA